MSPATGSSGAKLDAKPVSQSQAGLAKMSRLDLDDGAYPSSESDDEVEAIAPSKQSRPLLSAGEQAPYQRPDSAQNTGDSSSSRFVAPPIPRLTNRNRRTPLKWTEVIWVTLTSLLIAVLGYTSQLFIMLPYYHKTPSFSALTLAAVLAPFNLGLFGIFYNYCLCVTTDPGSVPAGYQPEWSALDPVHPSHTTSSPETTATLELKQLIYRPRYCKTCSAYKPPRAHHCKTCGRCVLRMDHHCPWLANCVGHHNYASFLRFLFFVDLSCTYHLLMISARVLDRFNMYSYWREPSTAEVVWLVVNYALCIPVLVLVGCFSGYHFYCVAVNQTTIESWEKDRVATMVRRGRVRKVKYPYDLGVSRNMREVLGANPLLWCCPGKKGMDKGDGVKYPVAVGLDPGAQHRWPPKDPTKNGWTAEAPPLFSAPPGASSTSPFTYGSGFNPSLRPTNSLGLRQRTQPYHDEAESGSTSSDSDDQLVLQPRQRTMAEPDADQLAALDGYDDHMQEAPHDYQDYEYVDDEEQYDPQPRVMVRRGSEGYEVRPRAAWTV